ncbi:MULTISPECIES: GIY-YIG nuclease family protein [Brucella/Ochrobactrum group]|uniref:GIY-YIG nuclease family protein n=1 Tax=Brucella pituitosa TaxID=571256 RepID=UPI001374801E|nr:GIY-YIG nuclease family protein [Ochrobactrum sp. BTU1]
MTNQAWPGKCKIGFAKSLTNRIRQMNTNDPFRSYQYHDTRRFDDRSLAEKRVHGLVAGFRIPGTEWFDLHPDDAVKFLRKVKA